VSRKASGNRDLAPGVFDRMSAETRICARNMLRGCGMPFPRGTKYPAFQMIHHLAGWFGGAEPLQSFNRRCESRVPAAQNDPTTLPITITATSPSNALTTQAITRSK